VSLTILLGVAVPAQAKAYLFVGIFFLAASAILHYYIYLRLRDAGHNKDIANFLLVEVPVDYWRLRAKYEWSPWPAILVWPALIAGLVLFVLGVFRL
jgi:hypothetical protein